MRNTILQGDTLKRLKELPDALVDCCVTSPPYWGLRDYGIEGQLGLEPTLDKYIQKLTNVFQEVRRVLKDDGTLWLNTGDGYAGSWSGNSMRPNGGMQRPGEPGFQPLDTRYAPRNGVVPIGLKPKDLIGLPWRVAFALQADGWYLRSDIIWAKPNPMPESVTDRPTRAHEYLFLLSKSKRYYYDTEAIKEPCGAWDKMPDGWDTGPGAHGSFHRAGREKGRRSGNKARGKSSREYGGKSHAARGFPYEDLDGKRNKRTVWTISTQPFPGAHFATFPEKLIEPCILAGTSAKGYCSQCGKAWIRVTEKTKANITNPRPFSKPGNKDRNDVGHIYEEIVTKTIGWQPSCSCGADTVPGLVLDPFMGSGTTALVAKKLNRDYLGIELNSEYIDMAKQRLRKEMPLFVGAD